MHGKAAYRHGLSGVVSQFKVSRYRLRCIFDKTCAFQERTSLQDFEGRATEGHCAGHVKHSTLVYQTSVGALYDHRQLILHSVTFRTIHTVL